MPGTRMEQQEAAVAGVAWHARPSMVDSQHGMPGTRMQRQEATVAGVFIQRPGMQEWQGMPGPFGDGHLLPRRPDNAFVMSCPRMGSGILYRGLAQRILLNEDCVRAPRARTPLRSA